MSPILVRPVREQLEHDRVIRILAARLKRKYDVTANVGDEQAGGIKIGAGPMFPDLLLTSQDKGHRLEGIIEVETGESVNHLEAMAQWAHFGQSRAPFHLYVPAAAVDIARRLCTENHVSVAEIWSYHTVADQTRFTLAHRGAGAKSAAARPVSALMEEGAPKRVRPPAPSRPAKKVAATPARKLAAAKTPTKAPTKAATKTPTKAPTKTTSGGKTSRPQKRK